MFVFASDEALLTFIANNPQIEPLFQFPPCFATRPKATSRARDK